MREAFDIRDLKVFVAVYETRGFARASSSLKTVQSNVSARIKKDATDRRDGRPNPRPSRRRTGILGARQDTRADETVVPAGIDLAQLAQGPKGFVCRHQVDRAALQKQEGPATRQDERHEAVGDNTKVLHEYPTSR